MTDKKINTSVLIILLSFSTWILTSFLTIVSFFDFFSLNTENNNELDFTQLLETYKEIEESYLDKDTIDKQKLIDWATKWLVDALWDKHTTFFNKEETQSFDESLSWDFEWIWAVIEKVDLWIMIDMVIKGSPAKKHWLKKWDIIVKADWTSLEWLTSREAVKIIKWPAWTSVFLTIIRKWEAWFIEKEVIRDKIKIPSVNSEKMDNIWYISVNIFWEKTADDFKEDLDKLEEQWIEWLIIDLRYNWWWYMWSAISILSNFLDKWSVAVRTKTSYSDKEDIEYVFPYFKRFKWKVVVLVNWSSASASEITAWALREYEKAIIVWEQTYWKWSVQKPIEKDYWMIKVTIAKWFTPNWNNIDWEWITPDIIQSLIDEENKDLEILVDLQLEKAKEVLNEFIKIKDINETIKKFN